MKVSSSVTPLDFVVPKILSLFLFLLLFVLLSPIRLLWSLVKTDVVVKRFVKAGVTLPNPVLMFHWRV